MLSIKNVKGFIEYINIADYIKIAFKRDSTTGLLLPVNGYRHLFMGQIKQLQAPVIYDII